MSNYSHLPKEDDSLSAFFTYVRLKSNSDPKYSAVMHVPNEAKRSWAAGKRMKGKGLSKGFPDIFCFIPNEVFHGLAIELKRKPNKVSPEQQAWLDRLTENGYLAVVAWSAEEAISILDGYLRFSTVAAKTENKKDSKILVLPTKRRQKS